MRWERWLFQELRTQLTGTTTDRSLGAGCALQLVRVSRPLFAVNGVAVLCVLARCWPSARVDVVGIGLAGLLWLVGTRAFMVDWPFVARKLWL